MKVSAPKVLGFLNFWHSESWVSFKQFLARNYVIKVHEKMLHFWHFQKHISLINVEIHEKGSGFLSESLSFFLQQLIKVPVSRHDKGQMTGVEKA